MIFFFQFIISKLEDDFRERKFIGRNSRYSGSWEYSPKAQLNESILYLAPSIPHQNGIANYDAPLPNDNWSVLINFTMPKQESNVKTGIWFSHSLINPGICFGGQFSFKGLAILTVWNTTHFLIELRENDGQGTFTSLSFFPSLIKSILNENIIFNITYSSLTFNIKIINGDQIYELFNDRPRINVKKFMLAVTAMNIDSEEPVIVNSISIKPDPYEKFYQIAEYEEVPKIKSPSNQTTAIQIIRFIDQIIDYTTDLAGREEVQGLIEETLLPFIDAWQRKSILIVNKTRALQEQLNEDLNQTRSGLKTLRGWVEEEFQDYRADLRTIESKLFFGILKGHNYNEELRNMKKSANRHPAIKWFVRIGVIEIIGLIILLIYSKFAYQSI